MRDETRLFAEALAATAKRREYVTEAEVAAVLSVHRLEPDQIEAALDFMKERGVEPVVATRVLCTEGRLGYRETPAGPITYTYRHALLSSIAGDYPILTLRVDPTGRGTGFAFANETSADSVPRALVEAAGNGVATARRRGIYGIDVVDFTATLLDLKLRETNTDAATIERAAAHCFNEALKRSDIILLEAVMALTISTPDMFLDKVVADLNRRCAVIVGFTNDAQGSHIAATTMFSALHGYSQTLAEITKGQGKAAMTVARYEPAPKRDDSNWPYLGAAAMRVAKPALRARSLTCPGNKPISR